MNLSILLSALRQGASVKNPTPVKWAGFAVLGALVALNSAQAAGYLLEVESSHVIEIVFLLLALYAETVSTDKIGLWPRARDAGPTDRVDGPERLRDQPLPPDPHRRATGRGGFPDGPFWGDL